MEIYGNIWKYLEIFLKYVMIFFIVFFIIINNGNKK